jgi:K+-transporting ATPase ATPase C chain
VGIIKQLRIACLMTITTTVLLGVIYPLVITGLAQIIFPWRANGELLRKDGLVIGSHLIGQPFSSDLYFHSRLSGAGSGYDASSSGAHELGPTNHQLIDRVRADAERLHTENPLTPVPVDLVTESASGLDPDISPAAAEFQIPRVSRARGIDPEKLRLLISENTENRQLGFLGERRVNVLDLNLALDRVSK